MLLTDDQVRRLLDVANTGCMKGLVAQARIIYEGILADRPGFVPALLGQALSLLVVDDFEKADAVLRAILANHPDDQDASVLLGLTCHLAGRKDEAAVQLEAVAGHDGPAGRLAQNLLTGSA